ncbi:hypothetical protein HYU94_03335 [Candidatus Daviesbacteria bacterium]|nr:hypothetical protein [Candidatus Daviesbacteria bacterium]
MPEKLGKSIDSQTVFNNQIDPEHISINEVFDSAEKLDQSKTPAAEKPGIKSK